MKPDVTQAAIAVMSKRHWSDVRAIYQVGIDTGHATFAPAPPPSWQAWQEVHLNELSLVALDDTVVLAWVALSPVSRRAVYAGVAEVSLYVTAAAMGRGIGRQLLNALVERSERANIWTLQAGGFPENLASLALHRGAGFEPVGLRRRIGKMTCGAFTGRWRDVLLLERRSSMTGIA